MIHWSLRPRSCFLNFVPDVWGRLGYDRGGGIHICILPKSLQHFGHLMWRTDSLKKTLMLKKIGEGDDRGCDGWMASPTRWIWVWGSFRSWWWTGKPVVLQSKGSQTIGHNWATQLSWSELKVSWKCRVLTKHGPLKKGMVNHFSTFALRTP